jgi:hypothetical protein
MTLTNNQDLAQLSTVAAIIVFAANIIFLYNFFYSIFWGKKATQNPWKSNTLEWTTPINVGHGNWEGEIPVVYRWPYDYSKPGAADDFIPQNVPFSATPESNFPYESELIGGTVILCLVIQLVPGHITQKIRGQNVIDILNAVTGGSKLSRYDIGQFNWNRISVQF